MFLLLFQAAGCLLAIFIFLCCDFFAALFACFLFFFFVGFFLFTLGIYQTTVFFFVVEVHIFYILLCAQLATINAGWADNALRDATVFLQKNKLVALFILICFFMVSGMRAGSADA